MRTVNAPVMIVADGPFSTFTSPTRAAGRPLISTVADPVRIGPPTCGTPGGDRFPLGTRTVGRADRRPRDRQIRGDPHFAPDRARPVAAGGTGVHSRPRSGAG